MRKLTVTCLAIVLLVARPAAAQSEDPGAPPNRAEADGLFTDALALMEENKFSEALEKLERAQSLDPGIGTEFNIALCYERLGKLAAAWRHYTSVLNLARASGKERREESAHQKLEAVRPRLSSFVFEPARPAALTIRLDGIVVPADAWAMVPVDAGPHAIEAEAPGQKTWATALDAPPAGQPAVVRIPALLPIDPPVVVVSDGVSTRRTVGFILGGVGVAGLAAATVTGIMLLDAKSSADDACKPTCANADGTRNEEGIDAVNRGRTLMPLNLFAWGIAAVGLGSGAYLVLTSGKAKTRGAALAPLVSSHLAGITLGGGF